MRKSKIIIIWTFILLVSENGLGAENVSVRYINDITYTEKYVTDNKFDSVFCDIKYNYFINEYYDKKINKCEFIHKRLLGNDSGGLPIYEYDYCPNNYEYIVLLSAGMNANELTPIFALSYFLSMIIAPSTDYLQYIHEHVRIKIIPVLCPSSFDSYHKSYTNHNGVNINRNFDFDGSWNTLDSKKGSWSYKGNRPQSEPEANVLKSWIDNNIGANAYIDCHSMVGGIVQNTFYTFTSDFKSKARILEAQSLIKRLYEDRGYGPTKESVRIIKNGKEYPKLPLFYKKSRIPSIMIEQYPGDITHGGSELHNDKGDIENYVLMITLYTYHCISKPNYFYLILSYKKHISLFFIIFAIITLIIFKSKKLLTKKI